MPTDETDRDWEFFANEDPYWAVLTQDRFRKKALSESERREFFSSGETHIDWVFSTIRHHIHPRFNPVKGLDFGCGVGRLLLPIARRCQTAVGIDVSDTMLREAEKNSQKENMKNISLVKGDDNCSNLTAGFDFINSFIVLQHIPCDRGVKLFHRLLELLNQGGVGAVHFTYSHSCFPVDAGSSNYEPGRKAVFLGGRDHLAGIKRAIQNRLARSFQRKKPSPESNLESYKLSVPTMQMNSYSLNPLFQILQEAGVREMHLAFTDHTGALGTVLFFRKGAGAYLDPALCE